MARIQRFDLTRLDDLDVQSQTARTVAWQGRPALHMEDGLVLLRGVTLGDGSVEPDLGTPGGRLQAQEPFGWGLACALFKP